MSYSDVLETFKHVMFLPISLQQHKNQYNTNICRRKERNLANYFFIYDLMSHNDFHEPIWLRVTDSVQLLSTATALVEDR
jgi:hypothetical protein